MEIEEKDDKKPVIDVKPIEPDQVLPVNHSSASIFEKTPPLTIGLLGILGGVVLMIALGACLYYTGRLSFNNNRYVQPGMMQQMGGDFQNVPQQRHFRNWSSFDDDFRRMDDQFGQMQQMHDQMMDQFRNDQPVNNEVRFQSNMNVAPGQGQQSEQGSFSFALNGQQYQLPYSVQNQQFSLKVGDLKNYLSADPKAKVLFQLLDAQGNVVKTFGSSSDFSSDISVDLAKSGVSYLDLSVTDGNGNGLLQVRQQL